MNVCLREKVSGSVCERTRETDKEKLFIKSKKRKKKKDIREKGGVRDKKEKEREKRPK